MVRDKDSGTVKILDDVVFVFLAYKQEKYLPYSLPSAINQTCYPSVLIVMDDASPDNSDQLIIDIVSKAPPELNIEYSHNTENVGLVGQLNKLVGRFKNKLIVLQAGDDESYPNRLEETYEAWINNGKPSLVLANYDCIDADGELIERFNPESASTKPYSIKRIINRRSVVYGCCAAIDSELFNFYGPISNGIINEDRVNAFRAYFQKGIFYLNRPLLKYRSEVGISAFTTSTPEEHSNKISVEATRELLDIDNHLLDLNKVDGKAAKQLLLKRKKNVKWLAQVRPTLGFIDVLKAIVQGVNFSVVLKAYKKIKR